MIGIGILNYMNYMVTKECVTSILMHSPTEDYKIFILDGSIDRMIKSLRDRKDVVVVGPKILTGGLYNTHSDMNATIK